ncbi:hypothetical protein MFRU_012g01630 [Monilinia fructicola]|uniref:Uncharacterized protein n=1 Tax=Monilinia fructicola TaxID=38448 RepID=A0A5M9JLF0_MONFR|nr:hypothetical protein EYC84_007643 [Monilinia fructicola]KAG4030429.1 hypothetical protein MFRU_012g01630 [Monilinia fructicola]
MQFSKISSATAALLISMISASPIALISDTIHPSRSIHIKPTGPINYTFKTHPTGSFHPKEPIPTFTDEENPKFTIHSTGGKTEPHDYHPSGTGAEFHQGPKPTGHVNKSQKGPRPTENIFKRDLESDGESITVSESHKPKPTGSASHGQKSDHAKSTSSGKKEHYHPSGTGVREGEKLYESGHANPSGKGRKGYEDGYAKPTGSKEHKPHESGHAKPSGKGGREHESGYTRPTVTWAEEHSHIYESGNAKPTDHKESARAFESGQVKPTGTGHAHESGHAKASGKGGKDHASGHAKPTGTGVEHGHVKPTDIHSQRPVFTGTHEIKSFEFKTETLTFGTKTFTVTGVVPEKTEKPYIFEEPDY